MSYSSSLTDQEWEILEPLLCQVLPQKKQTRPSNWAKRDIQGRHLLPTQEWLQLAGFTQRFAALLHGLLALQAVASRRGDRETDASFLDCLLYSKTTDDLFCIRFNRLSNIYH
jgi:hypothetical protein